MEYLTFSSNSTIEPVSGLGGAHSVKVHVMLEYMSTIPAIKQNLQLASLPNVLGRVDRLTDKAIPKVLPLANDTFITEISSSRSSSVSKDFKNCGPNSLTSTHNEPNLSRNYFKQTSIFKLLVFLGSLLPSSIIKFKLDFKQNFKLLGESTAVFNQNLFKNWMFWLSDLKTKFNSRLKIPSNDLSFPLHCLLAFSSNSQHVAVSTLLLQSTLPARS